MKNSWKTTSSGIVAIVMVVLFAFTEIAGIERPEVTNWTMAVGLLTSAIGNLFSKDDDKDG